MANNPPPYDNITGISRAVMKDNAQETLNNYDGNARPGELVVDLTQDPPPLYVGNSLGQLTLVSSGGGGGGLPLANGTSNFNIATINSNVTITAASTETWTFDTDGNVTIPGGINGLGTIRIDNLATGTSADIDLYAADNITLQGKDQTVAGNQREGGDININGGDGSPADGGDQGGTGGDIQIVAGLGGDGATGNDGGDGGFIRIYSGNGGSSDSGTGASSAAGGEVHIRAGTAGNNGGNNALGANGGDIRIQAGDSSFLTTGMGAVNFDSGLGTDNGVDPRVPGEYRFGYRSGNGTEQLIYKEVIAALAFTPKPLAFLGSASAAGAGARAFVNNGNLVASGNFGAVIGAGGSNIVPVFSDGTNWRIG